MAARVGRQCRFFFGGDSPADEIAGVREKGLECNGEPVDITSDEDLGVRTLLDNVVGVKAVNVTVSGVTKDTRIRDAWFAGQYSQPVRLEYPSGATIVGTFHLVSYSETEPYQEATTFQASLQSNGTVTLTP
jgi:predicted secreted protein